MSELIYQSAHSLASSVTAQAHNLASSVTASSPQWAYQSARTMHKRWETIGRVVLQRSGFFRGLWFGSVRFILNKPTPLQTAESWFIWSRIKKRRKPRVKIVTLKLCGVRKSRYSLYEKSSFPSDNTPWEVGYPLFERISSKNGTLLQALKKQSFFRK